MSLRENATEEELMLSILIDEGIQPESTPESHCSQKRKAADLEYEDNLKEKRSLEGVFYVLYISSVIDISYKLRRQQINIWFCMMIGKSASEMLVLLTLACGEYIMKKSCAFEWRRCFEGVQDGA
jgi:hypothetical protein